MVVNQMKVLNIVVFTFTSVTVAVFCSATTTYSYDANSYTLTISGTGDMDNYSSVDYAPWRNVSENIATVKFVQGVTSIGSYAFAQCTNLSSIDIPSSVTFIGESAFYKCSRLASIIIPSTVTSLGDAVFQNCDHLTDVRLLSSLHSISKNLFANCTRLKKVNIPSTVVSIGESAFIACRSLTLITIPSSVISVGNNAFDSCVSLTSVTIPSSVTSIGNYVFNDCDHLTDITILSSMSTINKGFFNGCSRLRNVNIPSTVTKIENQTFSGCSSLTSIIIPYNVTIIEGLAFKSCSNLRSIAIFGTNDSGFVSNAFEDCPLTYVCVSMFYTPTSFLSVYPVCKSDHCEKLVIENNQCYEITQSNVCTVTVEKRHNADEWETNTNNCFEYKCDNSTGCIIDNKCSKENGKNEICVDDKCAEMSNDKEDEWIIEIETGEGVKEYEFNRTEFILNIMNSTEISVDEVEIGAEVNMYGDISRIYIKVNDELHAHKIESFLNNCTNN